MRDNGYAAGTSNRVLVLLRYIFNLARKWNVPGVGANPAAGLSTASEVHRQRFLTAEETRRRHSKPNRCGGPKRDSNISSKRNRENNLAFLRCRPMTLNRIWRSSGLPRVSAHWWAVLPDPLKITLNC